MPSYKWNNIDQGPQGKLIAIRVIVWKPLRAALTTWHTDIMTTHDDDESRYISLCANATSTGFQAMLR